MIFGLPWQTVSVACVAGFATAGLGGLSTPLTDWYYQLRMPGWKPPNWAFGPIWTVIFLLGSFAAAFAWEYADRMLVLLLFGANAALNVFWSVLFFAWRRPDWALVEVVFLWLSILALIVAFAPRAPVVFWLLLPYIVWVSIAALLNRSVVKLNGPFDRS